MTVADKMLSIVLIAISLIVIGCQGLWASDDGGKLIQISVDGETYGKTVVLPVDADYSQWQEVTEAGLPCQEVEDV